MKKAFTLVEMLIVILIIWILLSILWNISWNYIHNLNVQNDKETLENAFSFTQTTTLSQPNFGTKFQDLSYLGIKLSPWTDYITYVWLTWEDNTKLDEIFSVKAESFGYVKIWTWFKIDWSWNNSDAYFWYKPYKIESSFYSNETLYTWNKTIEFALEDRSWNKNFKKCFRFDLALGRLYNKQCE